MCPESNDFVVQLVVTQRLDTLLQGKLYCQESFSPNLACTSNTSLLPDLGWLLLASLRSYDTRIATSLPLGRFTEQ